MGKYSKFLIAAIGGAITAGLAIIPPQTTLWMVLTVVSAALTASGVYAIPNAK